jgi:hypothetical protein
VERHATQSSKRRSVDTAARCLLVAALLILTASALIPRSAPSPVVAQSGACNQSSPPGQTYVVELCITAPADGAVLSGDVTVAATATVTGANPGINELIYYLDRQSTSIPILTDFAASGQSTFTFTLPTAYWVDGSHTLEVQVMMKSGGETGPATDFTGIDVTFANGVTAPHANLNTFQPLSVGGGSGPIDVAAIGDGPDGQSDVPNVTNLIASWNPSLLLYLGDVYNDGRYAEFTNYYEPTLGQFRGITNPTIGNHEYEDNDVSGYLDYWDTQRHYYSFDAGGWHIVTLDTSDQYNQFSPGTAQYDWLANELTTNAADCTLVYYHHPLFTVGEEGPQTELGAIWQLMAQHGVDLVLTGHQHNYERWTPLDGAGNPDPNGITQIIAGTGGHGLQQQIVSDSRMVKGFFQSDGIFGAVRLELNTDGAGFQFVSTSGVVHDSGTVDCTNGPDTEAPTTPSNLTAATLSGTSIRLQWTASTDNAGVEGYDIYRDGNLVTQAGSATTFDDTGLMPGQDYTYQIRARDAADNLSPFSDEAATNTAALFSDGFESGNMGLWQPNPTPTFAVQTALAHNGTHAARGNPSGVNTALAFKKLDADQASIYYRVWFNLASKGANNVTLLALRTSAGTTGAQLASLYINNANRGLYYRNNLTLVNTPSSKIVEFNQWYELQVHVVINGGTTSQVEVWLNGVPVPELTLNNQDLGSAPVGRIQLGETTGNRVYDIYFDDVVVNSSFIESDFSADTTPPTTPALTINASGPGQSLTGSTLFYNSATGNSGSFTVSATSSDLQSGIGHIAFPEVFSGDSVNDATSPYEQTYNWSAGSTASGTKNVKAVNGEGVSASSAFTVTPDTDGPLQFGISGIPPNASIVEGRPIAANITDLQSGAAQFEAHYCPGTSCAFASGTVIGSDSTAPFAVPWTGQPADGAYTIVARATDKVGNTTDGTPLTVFVDNTAPTAPTNLTGVANQAGTAVDLAWTEATDAVGVVAYDIYRNGTFVTSVNGSATSHSDNTVSPNTTYTYVVRARDGAGHTTPSTEIQVTTSGRTFLFTDGFESGNLAQWNTVSGLVVQQAEVYGGAFAARGTTTSAATYVYKTLSPTQNELYYKVKFKYVSPSAGTVTLLKFRTDTGTNGTAIVGLFVSSTGRLALRNDILANSTNAAINHQLNDGQWHEVELRARISSPQTDVWLDGVHLPELSLTQSLGSTPIGRLQLGENSPGKTYDVVFDEVVVDPLFIPTSDPGSGPTPTPTQTPTNTATFTPTSTPTLTPTNTLTPSNTPTATNTLTPSNTPTPTNTATNTPTATNTATSTPTPTPTPVVLNASAVADAEVRQSSGNSNFGSAGSMNVIATSGSTRESYLKFIVTGVVRPIQSATLRVFATNGSTNGPAVFTAGSGWTENGITWNNRPSRTTTPTDDKGQIVNNTVVNYNVTALVSANGTYTFVIAGGSSSDGTEFASRQNSNQSRRPQLIITLVPPPTPTPTATPTRTPTNTPTNTATNTPTNTPTNTAVPPTNTPTNTPTSTPTFTPTDTATNTSVPPTATSTETPTNTPVPPTATDTPEQLSALAAVEPLTGDSLSLPLRAMFYYSWFPNQWTQLGIYPYVNYHPTLGYYSSNSSSLIANHIAAMQYGGVQVGINSWSGQGSMGDQHMPLLLAGAAGTGFKWSIYHEQEGRGDPTVEQLASDLAHMRAKYANDPSYLRINGKFVVFVYADPGDGCAMVDRWVQANTVNTYLVLKVFPGYASCPSQPDSWHQYAPAVAADSQPGRSYTISPGFWMPNQPERLARDLTRWNQNIRNMIASGAPWQLITSFNEWGEGTSVENADEWTSSSGYGYYLDALHSNGNGPIPTATPSATPTETPTSTPFPPTDTPTFTPEPPTNTPEPPTNTPFPPTDTPVPPTDTPVPPTDTPVPPTETPILTATADPGGG